MDALVTLAVALLAENKPLPEKNRDHALAGKRRLQRERMLLLARRTQIS